MSDKSIEKMSNKELRKEVQLLRDEVAIMRRKYEDILYNLDDDNFSSKIIREKANMKTEIAVTAEAIKTKVSTEEMQSQITQTAGVINLRIDDVYDNLSSEIQLNEQTISAIVRGDYTSDLLEDYFTGIIISPNSIKMVDNGVYSVYNHKGLIFYDSGNQKEGWSIEPDSSYGGVLNYYINGGNCYRFGSGENGTGYGYTDVSIKAINGQRGRFVVDVTNSSNKEVKFVGLDTAVSDVNQPLIFANEKLLATQAWVLENTSSGTAIAVFG